jgi:hypothetical protein
MSAFHEWLITVLIAGLEEAWNTEGFHELQGFALAFDRATFFLGEVVRDRVPLLVLRGLVHRWLLGVGTGG